MSLFGILAFTYHLGDLSASKRVQANNYAAQYPSDTDKRIADCPLDGPVAGIKQCIEEAIAASHDASRAEEDLSAQRQMADWAFWALIVSCLSACITAVGTTFLVVQIDLTRKALKSTVTATKEMKKSNKIARDIGQAQTRTYLSIKSIRPKVRRSTSNGRPCFPTFYLTIKNSGNSVANCISATIEMRHFAKPFEFMDISISENVKIPDCGVATEIESAEIGDIHFVDGLGMFPSAEQVESYIKASLKERTSHTAVIILLNWRDVFGLTCEHWSFYIVTGNYMRNPPDFAIRAVEADEIDYNFPMMLKDDAKTGGKTILDEWRRKQAPRS